MQGLGEGLHWVFGALFWRVCAGSSWRPLGFLLMAAPQTVVLGQLMIECLNELMIECLRKSCHGWRLGQSEWDQRRCGWACTGAEPFLFHVAVLKKGSSLAGGLALPVQVGRNLSCCRLLSLVLTASFPSHQDKLVCMLLALLGRASQAVPWGIGWARWWGKAAAEELRKGSRKAVCLVNCINLCVQPCFCRSARDCQAVCG